MNLLTLTITLSTLTNLANSTPSRNNYKRAITCLTPGSTATATWTNSAGQTCTYTGVVGSNYGTNSAGGEYAPTHHLIDQS